jgi:hypothetical protein
MLKTWAWCRSLSKVAAAVLVLANNVPHSAKLSLPPNARIIKLFFSFV